MSKRFEQAKQYTQKYKDILLPCKYCGSQDVHITSERSIFGAKNEWAVSCTTRSCDCTGQYTSVRKAVQAWNNKHKE